MSETDVRRGFHSHRCTGCRKLVRCQHEERAVHCPPSVTCDRCFTRDVEATTAEAGTKPLWVVSWGTMVALVFAATEGDAIRHLRDARHIEGQVAARLARPEDRDWWERSGGTWPDYKAALA